MYKVIRFVMRTMESGGWETVIKTEDRGRAIKLATLFHKEGYEVEVTNDGKLENAPYAGAT